MGLEVPIDQQFSAHRYPPLAFSVFRLPKEPLNLRFKVVDKMSIVGDNDKKFIVVDSDKLNKKIKEVWTLWCSSLTKESSLVAKPFQLSSLKIVIIRHWNCPQTIITKSPAKDTAAKRKV